MKRVARRLASGTVAPGSPQGLVLGLVLGSVLGLFLMPAPASATPPAPGARSRDAPQGDAYLIGYDRRPDVQAFIDTLVSQDGFVRAELTAMFARVHYNDTAAGLMNPLVAATPVPWSDYRARFVEPTRIDLGARFWRAHAADLQRAADVYGVPPQIIVAILDVETLFGRNTGNFRVLDVLTTLAFDYPNKAHDRSDFFRKQLEDYLILARDQSEDVFAMRGSYAGAIGMPQFMPESIRRFAVDFDGDGQIDLKTSAADSIGSVANFLAAHGWRRDAPIAFWLDVDFEHLDRARLDALDSEGPEPRHVSADLAAAGLIVPPEIAADAPLALITLADGDNPPAYLAGLQNFYVLTRYNRSYAYATAVLELAAAIKTRLAAP